MKKIYKIIFILSICFWICATGFSQADPTIDWQNTIGGGKNDILASIEQTTDGGYILGGFSTSNISFDKTQNCRGMYDYWIVKTDSIGNIQWQNTIGGSGDDWLNCIKQTTDGGYILGGWSDSNISGDKTENSNGNFDYWIVKTDASGNIQWQNTIGGNLIDLFYSLQQTTDGGYILGGQSNSDISGDKTENCMGGIDYWIVKTDSIGNIQWQNTIGGSTYDYLYSIQQTTDGGYILGGESNSYISGDKTENSLGDLDQWLVKTDSLGNIQWQNTIGGSSADYLYSAQQTTDGGYILGGFSRSGITGDKTENCFGDLDYWIVKTDATGNIQWQNTIGGDSTDYINSIQQTNDGGYIAGGWSVSDSSGKKNENSQGDFDYWIVKMDSSGIIQWQNTIGGNSFDRFYSMKQTADGGYILGGLSGSDSSGDKTENAMATSGWGDYWIIKLFPDALTGLDPGNSFVDRKMAVVPNPLVTQSRVIFDNIKHQELKINLTDISGRTVEIFTTKENELIIRKGFKKAGLYLILVIDENNQVLKNCKIIISD